MAEQLPPLSSEARTVFDSMLMHLWIKAVRLSILWVVLMVVYASCSYYYIPSIEPSIYIAGFFLLLILATWFQYFEKYKRMQDGLFGTNADDVLEVIKFINREKN